MKRLLFVLLLTATSLVNAQCNLITTANGSSVDCYGDCDGMITYVYQNVGTPGAPYFVSLVNATTGQTISTTTYTSEIQTLQFTDLCAGDYSIYVQGTSCSDQTFATVSQPDPLQVNVNTVDPFQGNNGSATIIVAGGTPSYNYSLDGGMTYQSGNTFTGLASGIHVVTVMDNNGCTLDYTFVLNDIGNCNMVVTANASIASCANNCDANIQYYFTGNQLNGPFTVELYNNYNQVVQTQNGNGYQGVFQNVCAGIYTVQVTDANGCTGAYTLTITQASAPVITGVTTTNSSYGTTTGTATFNVSGGTAPYEYSLDGVTYQSNNTFTGLAAGFYIGYVVDANGCTNLFCFIVDESTACNLALTSMSTNAGC